MSYGNLLPPPSKPLFVYPHATSRQVRLWFTNWSWTLQVTILVLSRPVWSSSVSGEPVQVSITITKSSNVDSILLCHQKIKTNQKILHTYTVYLKTYTLYKMLNIFTRFTTFLCVSFYMVLSPILTFSHVEKTSR